MRLNCRNDNISLVDDDEFAYFYVFFLVTPAGHSGTEGGRTRVTYFVEEGVFF